MSQLKHDTLKGARQLDMLIFFLADVGPDAKMTTFCARVKSGGRTHGDLKMCLLHKSEKLRRHEELSADLSNLEELCLQKNWLPEWDEAYRRAD